MFVSDSKIVMFDPMACHLPNVNPSNPGKMIDFVQNKDIIKKHPDQFAPLKAFGCDLKSKYKGTLFRFPFRVGGRNTKLCSQIYDVKSARGMLTDMAENASSILIFLKHVQSIGIYEFSESHVGDAPTELFKASITNTSRSLQRSREFMVTTVEGLSAEELYTKELCSDYTLDISLKGTFGNNTTQTAATTTEKWVVCTQLGGGSANAIGVVNEHMKLIPWGGAAAKISPRATDGQADCGGLVYCSLPLPVTTNLRQNINGYFELSSNRRDIWQGSDMAGEGMTRAQWNRALLASIAAPSMIRVILAAIKDIGPSPEVYGLFPVGDPFADPWDAAVRSFYTLVLDSPVLHSKIEGGKWLAPKHCVLVSEDVEGHEQLLNILLQEAVPAVSMPGKLYGMFMKWSPEPPTVGSPAFLRKTLRTRAAAHQTEHTMPLPCFKHPENLQFAINYITMDIAVEKIAMKEDRKGSSRHGVSSGGGTLNFPIISSLAEVVCELEGIPIIPLCNGNAGTLQKANTRNYDMGVIGQLSAMGFAVHLCKLAMDTLPQGSGADDIVNWIVTSDSTTQAGGLPPSSRGDGSEDAFYICDTTERELLCGREMGGRVLDIEKCSERMLSLLNLESLQQEMNIKAFKRPHFVAIYKDLFPPSWQGETEVAWSAEGSSDIQNKGKSKVPENNLISLEWLKLFWSVLLPKRGPEGNAATDDLSVFENTIPFVPTNEGVLRVLQKKKQSLVLCGSEKATRDTPSLATTLSKVGLRTLHYSFEDEVFGSGERSFLANYFQPCGRRGFLRAVHARVRSHFQITQSSETAELNGAASLMSSLDDEERTALRHFLCVDPMIDIEEGEIKILRCLPIYAVFNYPLDRRLVQGQQLSSSELPPRPPSQQLKKQGTDAAVAASVASAAATEVATTPLAESSVQIPFDVVHVSILPEHFILKEDINVRFLVYDGSESLCVNTHDAAEKCLLQVLGVESLAKPQVYLEKILPALHRYDVGIQLDFAVQLLLEIPKLTTQVCPDSSYNRYYCGNMTAIRFDQIRSHQICVPQILCTYNLSVIATPLQQHSMLSYLLSGLLFMCTGPLSFLFMGEALHLSIFEGHLAIFIFALHSVQHVSEKPDEVPFRHVKCKEFVPHLGLVRP
jgi:hypothetical protein